MVDVDQEHDIDAVRGELRVALDTKHGFDVVDLAFLGALLEKIEHLRLNVHGENLAVGPTSLAMRKREVAAAGADVGDDHARFRAGPS